jgi:adenosine deaminase
VLELCPTSNLLTKALLDEEAVRDTFRAFSAHGVPFTIATDGPEMMRTHLRDWSELLLKIGAVDEEQLGEANRRGHEASSFPGGSAWASRHRLPRRVRPPSRTPSSIGRSAPAN